MEDKEKKQKKKRKADKLFDDKSLGGKLINRRYKMQRMLNPDKN